MTKEGFTNLFSETNDDFARRYGPPEFPELDFQQFLEDFLSKNDTRK